MKPLDDLDPWSTRGWSTPDISFPEDIRSTRQPGEYWPELIPMGAVGRNRGRATRPTAYPPLYMFPAPVSQRFAPLGVDGESE